MLSHPTPPVWGYQKNMWIKAVVALICQPTYSASDRSPSQQQVSKSHIFIDITIHCVVFYNGTLQLSSTFFLMYFALLCFQETSPFFETWFKLDLPSILRRSRSLSHRKVGDFSCRITDNSPSPDQNPKRQVDSLNLYWTYTIYIS